MFDQPLGVGKSGYKEYGCKSAGADLHLFFVGWGVITGEGIKL